VVSDLLTRFTLLLVNSLVKGFLRFISGIKCLTFRADRSRVNPVSNYYRPTPGTDMGHWNVFPRSGASILNVPFDQLPQEVKDYLKK